MNNASQSTFDYARPRPPKPRDWGAWGIVAFTTVAVVVFCLFVLLLPAFVD